MEGNTAEVPQHTYCHSRLTEQPSPGAKNWVTMYARMFLGKTVPAVVMGVIFAISYLLNFVILRMKACFPKKIITSLCQLSLITKANKEIFS
jgi:hypothetical protein